VNLYRIGLHVLDRRNVAQPWLSWPTLLVMELDPTIPFDVLVELDVIRACKTIIDGPIGQFTIDQ
jgi:hypothetical protein